jgi:chorismate mutase domain of proteobacterial P-protein, clade 2
MGNNIDIFRKEIDTIDQQLLQLLNRRAACAQEIGEIKKQTGSPVFHPERENQVIQNLVDANTGPVMNASVAAIWREIMSACRALEQHIRVAFLGPAGTFTEEAAISFFGSSVAFEACSSIDAIFKSVSNDNCRFGVIPIENSTEGSVNRSLDLLQQSTLKIVGELRLTIRHQLLSRETDLSGIQTVYAHPQALAQCQMWLSENLPHAVQQAVSSNAEGALLASQNPKTAAIAGKNAADLYQLHTLEQGVQDTGHNRTRFLVLARQDEAQTPLFDINSSCTSLVVSVPNKPGALHDLLVPLKRHQVTLTKLESRPAKSEHWEYFFYMDIAGHLDHPPVRQAVEEVRQLCSFFKLLGSYSIRKEVL